MDVAAVGYGLSSGKLVLISNLDKGLFWRFVSDEGDLVPELMPPGG